MNKKKFVLITVILSIGLVASGASFAGEGPYNGHTRNWFEKNRF